MPKKVPIRMMSIRGCKRLKCCKEYVIMNKNMHLCFLCGKEEWIYG